MTFLDKFQEPAYAILRIMSGLMFIQHGTQKFFNFPAEFTHTLSPVSMAAGGIEIVAGVLIAIGFLTRPMAFIASGMSAVGYWMVHGLNDFYPINNGGELIALYCFIFLFIAARGGGIWSVDGAVAKT